MQFVQDSEVEARAVTCITGRLMSQKMQFLGHLFYQSATQSLSENVSPRHIL
jgi:hypothetical protein